MWQRRLADSTDDDVTSIKERYYEAESGLDDLVPLIRAEYPDAASVVLAFAFAPAAATPPVKVEAATDASRL